MTAAAVPDAATVRALPNLLIAGVKKAGTTSLFDWLGQHPSIAPSDVKATNFFTPLRHGAPVPPVASYAAHFAGAGPEPYRLESSTTYFYGGRVVAEAISRLLPDPRVLVTLRDPVDRLWSDYHMKVREHAPAIRGLSFHAYVDRCRAAYAEGDLSRHPGFTGFARGMYAADAEPWIRTFGERLRFVFIEQWSSDPRTAVGEILRWLELDPTDADALTYRRENLNIRYRSGGAAAASRRLYRAVSRSSPRARQLKPLLRQAHDRINGRPNHATMGPGIRAELEAAYRPANVQLARLLLARGQRDLPAWLSTSIAGG